MVLDLKSNVICKCSRDQIEEIRNEGSAGERNRLGVEYGIDDKNLDCPLDELQGFDMTRDLPADILHHFLLGWMKKAFDKVKENHLSFPALDKVCSVIDRILWVEYKSRNTGSAFRSIGSQIGRNIKSLAPVLWFALYTLTKFDGDEDSIDLLALVRVVYYMSKMSCVLFNE